ncbi:MAG: Stk1 family PASTA domain-containing Ser/Thr kinase [Bacillota bacterium]
MIGTLLVNRYEILEVVGGGGMSLVYKAKDTWLKRLVAVKVLRPEFTNDEDFIRRFRREAQAVASLSHPNIVNIYDVGVEQAPYFIVMEYIEGKTLNWLIKNEAPLAISRVVVIAKQIAEALRHAHTNQIIHRDIKPHNILLTEDERVKVTDFGIARAVTTSTLTHSGSIIGSVHYFSPEQARGNVTGEKSDLYSLGIVLYEMLTGQVPFKGDSPVSIALKHIQEAVPAPSQLRPDTPPELESIVMKLLQKDESERYQNAGELVDDLTRFQMTHHDGIPIPNLQDSPTQVLPELKTIRDARQDRKGKDEKNGKKRPAWVPVAVWTLVIFLLVGGAMWGVFYALRLFTGGEVVPVPDVRGKSLVEAVRLLQEAKLKSGVQSEVFDPNLAAGYVISQDPEPLSRVKADRVISLVVSRGTELKAVPDVTGKPERDATLELQNAGFKVSPPSRENHPEVKEGYVIRQDPRGNFEAKVGSEVKLTVSSGPAIVKARVPDLRGKTRDQALQLLQERKLNQGTITSRPQPGVAPGTIVSQDPAPDTEVNVGSAVSWVEAGAATNVVNVQLRFDEEPAIQEIKVVVRDASRTQPVRVFYQKVHRKGDQPISLDIPVEPPGVIEIYRNNKLESSKTF